MDQRAGRQFRVTRRNDVRRLFERGRRAGDRVLTLYGIRNGLAQARLGVAVSARHGGAVRRNRIKRLCREAFRLIRCRLPAGWDYMILPRVGVECSLQRVQASLQTLAPRLAQGADPGADE
jgi:ribonuclease P protein component